MKTSFLTIEIDGKCYDLPKDMQIPQIGTTFFIEDTSGKVDRIYYHIRNKKVFMISIYTTKV